MGLRITDVVQLFAPGVLRTDTFSRLANGVISFQLNFVSLSNKKGY